MLATTTIILLGIAFFIIAALYASVGFGGGSSYLAILSLYLKDMLVMKTAALLCNLVVVSGGSYLFFKKGYFDWKKCLPVVLSGVCMAFLGARIHLTQRTFFIALGSVLALSGLLLFLQLFRKRQDAVVRKTPLLFDVVLGAGIGFLSGMVGIGGGILLSPVLNLMRWDTPKRIAAVASFFIFVNSIAGLLGQASNGTFKAEAHLLLVLLVAVFLGGQLGSRISLRIARPVIIKALTGILVFYIGTKLILQYTTGIHI